MLVRARGAQAQWERDAAALSPAALVSSRLIMITMENGHEPCSLVAGGCCTREPRPIRDVLPSGELQYITMFVPILF